MLVKPPLIKICGIKTVALAEKAAKAGANYLGLIFHRKSKRYIDLDTAKNIAQAASYAGAIPVAVFVDHNALEMAEICQVTHISVAQLHGDTARKEHYKLSNSISRIYVLQVDSSGTALNQHDSEIKHLSKDRDCLLFDGLVAGSGEKIPTHNLNAAAQGFRYFLAGGLTAKNVSDAINDCDPYAVDVSSGVENSNGAKDLAEIERFISAVAKKVKHYVE